MSVKVDLDRLPEVVADWPGVPMLLTTDADGRPRASAVSVEWKDGEAVVYAGRRSVANAVDRTLVSLLWPAPPGEKRALLVDGDAAHTDPEAGTVRIRTSTAIYHVVDRSAGC
ncbi:MAG TPA: pyridoxamine 5'-phosphate oxidase family protein [Mycobacteriales bacterium]|jgi:hypothetical protein|nr:pyridoxamine 5'-phosphate oxidase family protein [Mycobacteriales bacterium]